MTDQNPPISNRGVPKPPHEKQTRVFLDWLRVTTSAPGSIADYVAAHGHEVKQPSDQPSPMGAYNTALAFDSGRADWHSRRPEQKICWTWTGADLAGYSGRHSELLAWALSLDDVTVTRLDIAFDVTQADAAPDDVLECYERGYAQTRARTYSRVSSSRSGGPEGVTVYIGGRQSTRLLRVYDKAVEQGVSGHRVRCELEVKKPIAGAVARAMIKHGILQAGLAAIADYIRTGVTWFDDITQGHKAAIYERPGRKETSWATWVKEVALPAVVKAAGLDVDGVRKQVRALVAAMDNETLG